MLNEETPRDMSISRFKFQAGHKHEMHILLSTVLFEYNFFSAPNLEVSQYRPRTLTMNLTVKYPWCCAIHWLCPAGF